MRTLDEYPALALLKGRGIPTVSHELALSEDEALAAAARIGYPVAIKVSAESFLHKTESGGVALGIRTEEQARAAYRNLVSRAEMAGVKQGSGLRGVLVQEMVSGGSEFILGGFRDPGFGPAIMFGLGGIYTELFKDASFRLAPVDEDEARRMVLETKASALVAGFRGAPPLDLDMLCRTIARLSEMMAESEEIVEFDINPFVVLPDRCLALDALFRLN
jgi:succinyl-CoA synthetase beta subunit